MQSQGQQYDDYGYTDTYQEDVSFGRQQDQFATTWPAQPPQASTKSRTNELSEMEIELEMMKRKRQMIHEQRQLLQEQQQLDRLQVRRQYENPPHQNYSNYGSGYGNQGPGRGMKRQAPAQPWNNRSKRFAGNPPQSYPSGPSIRPKFTPKAPAVRMEREAAFDVGPVEPPAARPGEVYHSKETASRSLLGRMEVLLGKLVREMREQFFGPPHNRVLTPVQIKALKERLRDRIHRMMLGKPMVSNQMMYEMYRNMHTSKGDLRLLNNITASLALDSKPAQKPAQPGEGAAKPTESVAKAEPTPTPAPAAQKTPRMVVAKETVGVGKYIRFHIHGMLENKLDEIFAKLYKLCEEDAALAMKEPIPIAAESDDAAKTEEPQAEKGPVGETAEGDKPAEDDKAAEGDKPGEDDEPADGDKPVEGDKPADGDKPVEGVEPATGASEAADGDKSVDEGKSDVEMKEVKDEEGKKKTLSTPELFEFLMDRAMRKKLAQILPRYRNYLLSIIARDKQLAHLGLKGVDDPTPPKRPPLMFVKILGKPSLPARNLMKEFLDQFECASIKKHKNIYNLLFVGVTKEENYKKLIASDGTQIGNKKLDIRPSIKDSYDKEKKQNVDTPQTNGETNGATDAVAAEEDGGNANKSLGNATDDLDNEIDSLLTAIHDSGDAATKADKSDIAQDETGQEETEIGQEVAETDGDVEETTEQADQSQEQVTEEKKEDSQAQSTPIRTRRSSRLPQKN